MNAWIKKNFNVLLIIFILLQPIFDLITGFGIHVWHANVTIGIIVRILFLLFIFYTVMFVYKRKQNWLIYGLLLAYGLFYISGMIMYKDGVGLFEEIQGLCRVFYFPVLLIALYSIKDEIKISKMTLMVVLVTYLVCILVPNCLNIGFETYEITKAGTLGFFNSANEISGIISLLTPIMILIFVSTKKIIPTIIISVLYLYIILTIGTKTPLLSLGITIFFAYIWFIYKEIKQKKYKPIGISLIALIVFIMGLVLILPKTTFYKNIETHLNYLKLDNVTEVFENEHLVDHFIFSSRLSFLEDRQTDYMKSNMYQKLFGIGYLKNNKEAKAVEMDYFDIYYSHGIIGFILFFGIYGYIFYLIMKDRRKLDFEQYMLYVSVLLSIFLSFFTGHIITAPAVSILVTVLLLMLAKNKKKKLLFTAYSLNVGGIETALINLVNRINLDKYQVEILLEKKEGIFLDKVKEEITVKEYKVYDNRNIMIRKFLNLTKRLLFTLINYHTYDFSCCYATYSLSGSKLAKIGSTNTSIYVHSNYSYLYKDEEFKNFFNAREIQNFKKIIFVSKEARQSFINYYPELAKKCLVINNFVNLNEIVKKSKGKVGEKKPKNKKLFVFVGRLDDTSKKLSRAINLTKEIKEIELWLVGDGPDRKKYEDLAKKERVVSRVKFLGEKTNPYPYIALADYVLMTSDYEGFPVTYLESIILKKPIITTVDVSDDKINMGKDYATIISKKESDMVEQVREELKNPRQRKNININQIQQKRMKELEKVFDEVI